MTNPSSTIAALLACATLAVVVGCTIEDEAPADASRDTPTPGEMVEDTDTATAGEMVEDTDMADVQLIDIEGIEVDFDNTCISPDVTVLGQGPADPPYYAPRCLREIATGTTYIARRGSAAVPDGFERCRVIPIIDWPVCGVGECGGATPENWS